MTTDPKDGYQGMYRTFTSADGLLAVEIDTLGIWLRRREHPSDMWSPPEEMLNAGGSAGIALHDRGEMILVAEQS